VEIPPRCFSQNRAKRKRKLQTVKYLHERLPKLVERDGCGVVVEHVVKEFFLSERVGAAAKDPAALRELVP
jgi:hypothetical protein